MGRFPGTCENYCELRKEIDDTSRIVIKEVK